MLNYNVPLVCFFFFGTLLLETGDILGNWKRCYLTKCAT